MSRGSGSWIVASDLVEIDSVDGLHGFSICKFDRSFNDLLKKKGGAAPGLGTYSFTLGSEEPPLKPDFRFQFYSANLDGEKIHYDRRVGPLHLRMSYDVGKKHMTCNWAYARIPFELGNIWPAGLHLSNIITHDLLVRQSVLTIHGSCFKHHGRTICFFSPRRTGKSTLTRKMLSQGAYYICEDALLTDGHKVYLTPPNDIDTIRSGLTSDNVCLESPIDEIVIAYPRQVREAEKNTLARSQLLMHTNRIPFFNDLQIQALVQYTGQEFAALYERQDVIIERLLRKAEITFVPDLQSWEAS